VRSIYSPLHPSFVRRLTDATATLPCVSNAEPDDVPHPTEAPTADADDAKGVEDVPEEPLGHGDEEIRLPIRINPALDLRPYIDATNWIRGIDLTGIQRMLDAFDVNRFMPDLKKSIMPAIDVSNLLPDMSAFKALAGLDRPLIDVDALLPKIDFAPFLKNVQLNLPDLSSVMPKFDFGPDLVTLLEGMRRKLPPNWSDDVDLEQALNVILEDGLPLVWVPRAETIVAVLAADDRVARVAVLVDALAVIAVDCDAVLEEVDHPTLTGQVPLAKRAVAALREGHHEAAQALAVVVTETAVARALGRDYKKVKEQVLFDPDLVAFTRLRLRAALAPIAPFYTAWWPGSGDPRPEALSRHVSVHQADEEHYTVANALLAVMLASSVLRALQELQEIADVADEGPSKPAA
jgi:hypothetical protein